MTIKIRGITPLTVAIGMLLSSKECFALTATTTFQVTATVTDVCTVTATALTFGNYASGAAAITGNNTVGVTCNPGTNFVVALNSGVNSANFTPRQMNNGVNLLNYNIYTTAALATVWGDGTNATVTQAGTGSGALHNITGFGQIPAAQSVPGGNYADTITVTVTYT